MQRSVDCLCLDWFGMPSVRMNSIYRPTALDEGVMCSLFIVAYGYFSRKSMLPIAMKPSSLRPAHLAAMRVE